MICLWRKESRRPKNGVSREGTCPKRLPLSPTLGAWDVDPPLPDSQPSPVAELVRDSVLKLVKSLSEPDAGGWFGFRVREPAHLVPEFCRGLCE